MRTVAARPGHQRRLIAGALAALVIAASSGGAVAARGPDRPDGRPIADGTRIAERTGIHTTATDGIEILSASAYLYDDGTTAVVGEARNLKTSRRDSVVIMASYYNGDTLLGSLTSPVFLTELAYGSISPFVVFGTAPDGTVAGTTSFLVSTSSNGTAVADPPAGALRITTGPTSIVGDERHFTGTITNVSTVGISDAYAAVTTYDGAGDVIDANWDTTTPSTIAPGASASYDIVVFYDPSTPVARSAITADAWTTGADAYHTAWANYFDDIGTTSFRPDIVWNADQGITTGCGPGRFCPTANVPRDQMASFLARALDLSGSAPDAFTDDETSVHEPNINLVAQAGIASGCAVAKFCPTALVSRDQMASFLSRALHLSGAAPDAFTDDNGNQHEPNINLVARDGIASGCGGTNYCPTNKVTRAQMAAFLHRAFD